MAEESGAARGILRHELEKKGDILSSNKGWSQRGIEAIRRFIIEKFHWLPREVNLLTDDELAMLSEDAVPEKKKLSKERIHD